MANKKLRLSEGLRVGKEFSDVPQAFADPEKTQGKFTELKEAVDAGTGLVDDVDAIREDPVAFGILASIGGMIETLREYKGDTLDFDLYDREGNPVFPQPPVEEVTDTP